MLLKISVIFSFPTRHCGNFFGLNLVLAVTRKEKEKKDDEEQENKIVFRYR